MPTHLHLIIWWDVDKKPDLTISKIMHGIKWHSAKEISEYVLGIKLGQGARALPTRDGDRSRMTTQPLGRSGATARPEQKRLKIWKPKFYNFNIYSENKLRKKLNYIHENPVRARLVKRPEDYEWSSYKLYI